MTWQLTEAISHHSRERPDAVALVGPDGELTYGQLFERASTVAADLSHRGVRPGDRVAIDARRTGETVCHLVGIMLGGAAYVPLDPTCPPERRRMLVEDCGTPLVLCDGARRAALSAEELPVPVVGGDEVEPRDDTTQGARAVDPDADAYVIYTSGSTGRPKGVRIQHSALMAFLESVSTVLGIDAESVCLNTTGLHFDASIADVLLPLVRGARVHLGPSMVLPALILDTLERRRITHMTAVGSTLTMLVENSKDGARRDLSALRTILTGAEVISPATVQAWLGAAPHLTVINGYGPTETTCGVTFHPISEREPGRTAPYPIGLPLPTATVCFRGPDGDISRDGPGELLVSGPQLMRGYLNRPDEEAAAFLDIDGVRHYRTGDIARRDEDGVLHFEGRHDDEVKLNGYRINLNEVRYAFEKHPAVSHAFVALVLDARRGSTLECALLLRGGEIGEPRLVELDEGLLRTVTAHAGGVLPKYMVPRRVRLLTHLPVLASGKPDRTKVAQLLTGGAASSGLT